MTCCNCCQLCGAHLTCRVRMIVYWVEILTPGEGAISSKLFSTLLFIGRPEPGLPWVVALRTDTTLNLLCWILLESAPHWEQCRLFFNAWLWMQASPTPSLYMIQFHIFGLNQHLQESTWTWRLHIAKWIERVKFQFQSISFSTLL